MGAYEDAVISNYHIAYKEYVEYKETHIGLHTQEERDKALELERRCNYWKAEYNKNECYKITGQTAYEFEGSAIDEYRKERMDPYYKYRDANKDEKSQKAQELLDSCENSNDKENSYS